MQHPHIRSLMMYLGLAFVLLLVVASVASGFSLSKPKTRDLSIPAHWCAKGDGIACLYVAQNLLFGDKKSSDLMRARAFYSRACVLGVSNACYELSKLQAYPATMYARYWRLWEREASLPNDLYGGLYGTTSTHYKSGF
ncbi:hypothetical protein [Helicobacter zhangjianzhongii]|uniref:Uncharacterized protein n=1 Tax=Helicobacter zhangjianzhongii TaxID=2974574 RepID=A0ACC6FRS0_9HELI|nr:MULTISPECIES: hypothetical protein [unclassified Helicobacter]MDL0080041.1 hypothetical protein [Helicobacter sp. CPD2-1]MDL0081830.1 hypothetical protein [Helicobacter sp. XJK30-2]